MKNLTLLQLWEEKKDSKLIAQSLSCDWFVLIEDNPSENISKYGKVFARMPKRLNQLSVSPKREVFGYDNKNWKKVNIK